jgi:hypothetical protein
MQKLVHLLWKYHEKNKMSIRTQIDYFAPSLVILYQMSLGFGILPAITFATIVDTQ